MTDSEGRSISAIADNVERLRQFFHDVKAPSTGDPPEEWLRYLVAMKRTMGNTSNWLSFIACLLAKNYLHAHLQMAEFDVSLKPQGAPGLDIDATTVTGKRVVAEIKTTIPYNQSRLGSAQQKSFQKDFHKLSSAIAEHKFLFVTDELTYHAVEHAFASQLNGIRLISLWSDAHEK
jgi:hypothetical protein